MFILILLFPVIFTIVWIQICLHSHDPLSEEFSVFPVVQVCLMPRLQLEDRSKVSLFLCR